YPPPMTIAAALQARRNMSQSRLTVIVTAWTNPAKDLSNLNSFRILGTVVARECNSRFPGFQDHHKVCVVVFQILTAHEPEHFLVAQIANRSGWTFLRLAMRGSG